MAVFVFYSKEQIYNRSRTWPSIICVWDAEKMEIFNELKNKSEKPLEMKVDQCLQKQEMQWKKSKSWRC